jgi:hypothetical protein
VARAKGQHSLLLTTPIYFSDFHDADDEFRTAWITLASNQQTLKGLAKKKPGR